MSTARTIARAAIVSLALVAMGWPTSGQSTEPSLVGTGWRIVEVAGRAADPAATIVFEKSRVSGSTGCNRFFASLAVREAALSVGPIATTKIFCGMRASLERATLAALALVASAKRDGATVVLLDASGRRVALLSR